MSSTAAVRLRRAGVKDAGRLAELAAAAQPSDAPSVSEMADWLEQGGALFYEDAKGTPVSSLRWREEKGGWRLAPLRTIDASRGLGYGRWLMTQVEALAIRLNIPVLRVELRNPDDLPYYRRLGYEPVPDAEPGVHLLFKRVGGTWQMRDPGKS